MKLSTLKKITRIGIGTVIAGAGLAHFTYSGFFIQLVPENLSAFRGIINTATAVLMIAMGLSFFVPRLRAVARWSSVVLLVLSLPAAIGQVIHPETIKAVGLTRNIAALRIIVQLVMIILIWWATSSDQTDCSDA